MIPCQACGHENPLGTLFCRQCGTRISISPDQVLGSVTKDRGDERQARILRLGRRILACGIFAIGAAIAGRMLIEAPNHAALPVAPATSAAVILAERMVDISADATTTDDNLPPLPTIIGDDSTTLAWRERHRLDVLGRLDPDVFSAIRSLQTDILAQRIARNGQLTATWRGDDEVLATALAVLALQAFPGDPDIDAAAATGRDFLASRLENLRRIRNPTALALSIVALWEAGQLAAEDQERLSLRLLDGRAPHAQALGLGRLPRAERNDVSTLERRFAEAPAWLAYTNLLSGSRPPGNPLENWSRPDQPGLDGWLWLSLAWYHGHDHQELNATLSAWRQMTPAPVSDEWADAGPAAASAFAVLALCAPIAVPVRDLAIPAP